MLPEKVISDYYFENNIDPRWIKKEQQVQLIKLLNNKYGLSQIKIGELLNMNRKQIYRLLKKFTS